MADNSTEIEAIEAILNSGATSVSVDGMSQTVDLAQLRKRLIELRNTDSDSMSDGRVRPRVVGMTLGGAW